MNTLRTHLRVAAFVARYQLCRLGALFVPRRHWVIWERGSDARDNGYWFYKYVKKQHPEQQVYYLIDAASADYPRVQEDAVQPGSWRALMALASARKLISSHYASCLPVYSLKLFRLLGLHKRLYFLQHGVIPNNYQALHASHAPMRLFICGAQPEYEYVCDTFGHPEGVVQYTGLARFDQLHDIQTKRQIVVMPTWRAYVRNEDSFLSSEYYRRWQEFLSDPRLLHELEEKDIQLVFYVHYEMQPYAQHFTVVSPRVTIARFSEYDVQTLLKESAALVTDYSSVIFDFAYMEKPVICYQFDAEEFFGKHYQRGYFDYERDGFGPVASTAEEAVSELLHTIRSDFQPQSEYTGRIRRFFPLRDRCNCQRIYDLISGDNA